MFKITQTKLLPLVLLVFLGQGCAPNEYPTNIPSASSQPTIPVPATTTPILKMVGIYAWYRQTSRKSLR